jgi:hypothetical protein
MEKPLSLEEWLDALPEAEIQRELDDLQAQLNHLSFEVNKRREVLEMKKRWREFYGVKSPESEPAANEAAVDAELTVTMDRPASIRESVLRAMASEPAKAEWSIQDIRIALVEREWMEDAKWALRSLLAALSRMTSDGDLQRVRRGVYRPAVQETALQTFADQGGASD